MGFPHSLEMGNKGTNRNGEYEYGFCFSWFTYMVSVTKVTERKKNDFNITIFCGPSD